MLGGSTLRRWAGGIGVLAAVSFNAVVAQPATAAETYAYAGARSISIAKESAGKMLAVNVHGSQATDVVVTVDFAGLANVATAGFPAICDVQGTKAACAVPLDGSYDFQLFVEVKPVAGVAVGAIGTLKYSVSAKDYPARSQQDSKVTVGAGPDLWVDSPYVAEDPAVNTGDYVSAPLSVGNQGDQSVSGIDVEVTYTRDVIPVEYEQCAYTESATHYITATCSFDGVMAPGDFVEFVDEDDKPIFGARMDTDAMSTKAIWFEVFGKGQAPAALGHAIDLPGVAKSIRLKPKEAHQRAASDVDQSDNFGGYRWFVPNHRDLAAAGDSGYGEVGDTVTLKLGFNNVGPGSLDIWTAGGEDYGSFWVRIPAGLELLEPPSNCRQIPNYIFMCGSNGDYIAAGALNVFEFKLKIHHPSNFTGDVALGWPPTGGSEGYDYEDENMANNKTTFQITLGKAPVAGPLPTTGSRVTLMIGGGAVLVALGAITFRLARRRRYPAV